VYFNSDIDLSSDFIAYDSSSNKIEKLQFLEELTTGVCSNKNQNRKYNPEHLSIIYYRQRRHATIKAQSETELSYLKRVGNFLILTLQISTDKTLQALIPKENIL
jgi:hypothetical protein